MVRHATMFIACRFAVLSGDQRRHGARRSRKAAYIEDEVWDRIPDRFKPDSRWKTRVTVEKVETPYFGDVEDRVGFIFKGLKSKEEETV